jgi:hypothetical protein
MDRSRRCYDILGALLGGGQFLDTQFGALLGGGQVAHDLLQLVEVTGVNQTRDRKNG